MPGDVVIRAEGLGKKYVIGHEAEREKHPTLRDAVTRLGHAALRKARDFARGQAIVAGHTAEEFWALRDVNFEVRRGDVLGLIGRNGAGKSTLLKILSRITEPSEGRVAIKGRVASLLEVGTGFHPELTGRENVYLNGAILGMSHAEIRRKFDEIVAFAEVERFLDTPVKRYSSGMYVRLAFAVAAHLEPEILIVDEVLAVGDAEFQKKCLGKMQDVAGHGRTVLFVSHNIGVIERLTQKTLLLDKGFLLFSGPTSQATMIYLGAAKVPQERWLDVSSAPRRHEVDGSAQIQEVRVWVKDARGGQIITIEARGQVKRSVKRIRLSFTIFRADSSPVGSGFGSEIPYTSNSKTFHLAVRLDPLSLAPGRYEIGIAIGEGDHLRGHRDYDIVMDCLSFDIAPPAGPDGTVGRWTNGWGGLILSSTPVEHATLTPQR